MNTSIRNNWTLEEIKSIYHSPLLALVYQAAGIHKQFHQADKLKLSTLISVKTGACEEDCSYCAQSSRHKTNIKPSILNQDETLRLAKQALDNGVPRVCLSASWKKIPQNKFENILDTIKKVKAMGLNVCLTMGTVSEEQAEQLSAAGINAYNHNIDTSKEFYDKIITTRTFDSRIETLKTLQKHNVNICSGGIIGLGESHDDRISMLHSLATLPKHPYTVPLNTLIPIDGTPLEANRLTDSWDIIRMIASTRIIMPATQIELAAGRVHLSKEAQALCFMAGVNGIFIGEKLLTANNPEQDTDMKLLHDLGLKHY